MQLRRDRAKLYAWPLYVELARSRYCCEGALVVLTIDASVRRWIARRIARGTGLLGTTRRLVPTVLALDAIPLELLLQPERPYLAVLAMAAHAHREGAEPVAEEAIRLTIEHLPDRLATAQLDAILGLLDRAMRARLEGRLMEHPRFRSETFRRWYKQATTEGRADGLAKGREEGLAKGREEGLAKGREEGLAKGRAEAVVAMLEARGIPVSEAIRARILRCTDLDRLALWIERAAVASSASAVVRTQRPRTGRNGVRRANERRSR